MLCVAAPTSVVSFADNGTNLLRCFFGLLGRFADHICHNGKSLCLLLLLLPPRRRIECQKIGLERNTKNGLCDGVYLPLDAVRFRLLVETAAASRLTEACRLCLFFQCIDQINALFTACAVVCDRSFIRCACSFTFSKIFWISMVWAVCDLMASAVSLVLSSRSH